MKAMRLPLTAIKKPERNIRIHTETQLKEFERSVKMFGQIRPIVIDENFEILAGNGLYETLKRLGWQDAEVYQYTDLTSSQKKKLMIADNRVYGLGIDDLETFDAFLLELNGDFDIPGFDAEVLQSMVSCPSDITEVMADYGKLSDDEFDSLKAAGERKTAAIQQETPNKPFANAVEPAPEGKTSKTICPHCGAEIWL